MKKHDAILAAAFAALLLAPLPVLADGASETVTAWTHADLAAKAGNADGVKMHLHHALNCLVGPSGAGFDAKQMNPCANAGNGAIPDTADAGRKAKLEEAANIARAGLVAADPAVTKKAAADTAAALNALK